MHWSQAEILRSIVIKKNYKTNYVSMFLNAYTVEVPFRNVCI